MSALREELVRQVRLVAMDCLTRCGVRELRVVDDLRAPAPWSLQWHDGAAVLVVNSNRLRFLSEFARTYELSVYLAEVGASAAGSPVQAAQARDPHAPGSNGR